MLGSFRFHPRLGGRLLQFELSRLRCIPTGMAPTDGLARPPYHSSLSELDRREAADQKPERVLEWHLFHVTHPTGHRTAALGHAWQKTLICCRSGRSFTAAQKVERQPRDQRRVARFWWRKAPPRLWMKFCFFTTSHRLSADQVSWALTRLTLDRCTTLLAPIGIVSGRRSLCHVKRLELVRPVGRLTSSPETRRSRWPIANAVPASAAGFPV